MIEIRVRNPVLFDRLRVQGLLRQISQQRGEQVMLEILQLALTHELTQCDRDRVRTAQVM